MGPANPSATLTTNSTPPNHSAEPTLPETPYTPVAPVVRCWVQIRIPTFTMRNTPIRESAVVDRFIGGLCRLGCLSSDLGCMVLDVGRGPRRVVIEGISGGQD